MACALSAPFWAGSRWHVRAHKKAGSACIVKGPIVEVVRTRRDMYG